MMAWPDEWHGIDEETADVLRAELAREICSKHPLYQQQVTAIARRDGTDDVLFVLNGQPPSYAEVHLTWRVESTAEYPWTTIYSTLEEWQAEWRSNN